MLPEVLNEQHQKLEHSHIINLNFDKAHPKRFLRPQQPRMSATLQKALHAFFKPVLLPAPHRAEMTSITSPGTTPFKVEDRARWVGGGESEICFFLNNEIEESEAEQQMFF